MWKTSGETLMIYWHDLNFKIFSRNAQWKRGNNFHGNDKIKKLLFTHKQESLPYKTKILPVLFEILGFVLNSFFCKSDIHSQKLKQDRYKFRSKIANKIGTLFVVILFFNPLAHTSLSNKCFRLFNKKSVTYSLEQNTSLQNPYSQLVFTQVYQQLSLLEGAEFSYEETQQFALKLEKLIQHLEKNSHQAKTRLKLLDSYLTPALENTTHIVSFIKSDSVLKYESLDTKTILQLIFATFSQHLHAYLTHPKTEDLDWPRLRAILESISSFKKTQPAFSLYKIYRSVREKYSMKEYVNCK